jgi:hypothetical protein
VTTPIPVPDRVLQLQGEVRRLEAGAQGEGQAKRVARRVAEIQSALVSLSGQARAARALQRYTDAATVNLTGLDAGRDDLARRAAGSIPSDPAFVAARRKIESTTSRLATEIQAVWKAWANEQLSTLPVRRIAMLEPAQEASAQVRLKSLRNLIVVRNVTASDIAEYASTYEGLMDELSEEMDVPEALLAVFHRMSRGVITLRELSEEEIMLLRQYRMDGEIELRRKNV